MSPGQCTRKVDTGVTQTPRGQSRNRVGKCDGPSKEGVGRVPTREEWER